MTRATAARVTTFGFFRGADVKGSAIEGGPTGIRFLVNDRVAFEIPICGRWMAYNALACRGGPSRWASTWCRFPSASRRSAFRQAHGALADRRHHVHQRRLQRQPARRDARARRTRAVGRPPPRVFVMGDMLELGADSWRLHEKVADRIARMPAVDVFVGVGPRPPARPARRRRFAARWKSMRSRTPRKQGRASGRAEGRGSGVLEGGVAGCGWSASWRRSSRCRSPENAPVWRGRRKRNREERGPMRGVEISEEEAVEKLLLRDRVEARAARRPRTRRT